MSSFKRLMLSATRCTMRLRGDKNLFLHRLARCSGGKEKPGFGQSPFNVSRSLSPFIMAASIGSAGLGGYIHHRYQLKQHRKVKDMDDTRNFQNFMTNHHIPYFDVKYKIERKSITDELTRDIVLCATSDKVVNIIAEISIGKSTILVEAARAVEKQHGKAYKLFYINGDETLRAYLKDEYPGLVYEDDISAVNDFCQYIKEYSTTKPKGQRVIVIIDSPGGIAENADPKNGPETPENAATRSTLVRRLKAMVSGGYATVYCISSPPNVLFTKERIAILGDGRYEETEQKDWIDFALKPDETMTLIDKYEKRNNASFTEQEKSKIMIKKANIGKFIKEMSLITRKG